MKKTAVRQGRTAVFCYSRASYSWDTVQKV